MNPLVTPLEPLIRSNDLGRDDLSSESMLLTNAKQILDSNRLEKF